MGISWEDFDRWYKERNIEKLLLGLKDENMLMRMETAKVLGEIGDKKAVAPLIDALKDKAEDVICASRISLSKFKDEKAIEFLLVHLLKSMNDKNWEERAAAVEMIGEINVLKYGNVRDRIVESLNKALGDDAGHIKILAAEVLGDIGDSKSVEPLRLALGDTQREVRKATGIALKKIATPEALDALKKASSVNIAPYDQVKDIVLGLFESFYPPEDEDGLPSVLYPVLQDKDVILNTNPNDFELDPDPFYEEIINIFGLDWNDFEEIFSYTLKDIIDEITKYWDKKTIKGL